MDCSGLAVEVKSGDSSKEDAMEVAKRNLEIVRLMGLIEASSL